MIRIRKNPNGDTRTAPKNVTFEQFQEANRMHKCDVEKAMNFFKNRIRIAGLAHDHTKISEEELFYDNFLSTINNGTDFVQDEWYQLHINKERHHLFSRCPDDVNLIDVMEMIADCVCAGMARSGEIRDLEIDDDILRRAVSNTVELLKKNIEVVEE